jgi:lysozyme
MPDIRGVDVASFQGEPGQWVHLPQAAGIQWAGVKFSEAEPSGNLYRNPDAKDDWAWLKANKKGRVAYLFAHPSVSVRTTVSLFKSMTDELGLEPADGVAIDAETTDGLSPATVASWLRELASELAALYGRRIIIYTFIDFALEGNCEGLEVYPLWIASITPAGLPTVPRPWKDWFAQQYSQAQPIDQDVAHFSSLAAMEAVMGKAVFEQIVAVHVTTGEESLISLSHLLQCGISTMIRLTLNGQANHLFSAPWADYLDWGNFQIPMPKGVTVRYYEQVRA